MCGQSSPLVMCSFFFLLNQELYLKGRTTCKFFGCTVVKDLVSQLGIKPTSSAVNALVLTTDCREFCPTLFFYSASGSTSFTAGYSHHASFIAMHEQSHCHGRRIVLMGQAQGMGAGVTLPRRKIQNLTFSDCLYPHSVIPQQTKKSAVILRHKILLGSISTRWDFGEVPYLAGPPLSEVLSQAASCPSHSSPAGSSLDAAAWWWKRPPPGPGAVVLFLVLRKAAWRGMSTCGPGRSSNLCIPWCLEESRAGWNGAGVLSCHWRCSWMWDAA